jgi:hypothetical protein
MLSRWPSALGLAALVLIVGCKSSNSDSGTRGDPLVRGPNIPPQNVPFPDRGGVGANGKDPLTTPTSKTPEKTGVGYGDDPARFKGTYIAGPNSVPAALAGKMRDGEELKIDGNENRVPLQQAGGVSPSKPYEQSAAVESLYRELERYGCKGGDRTLTQENGQFVFRASLTRPGANGARLLCTETGATPEEAIKKVLDDVSNDQ